MQRIVPYRRRPLFFLVRVSMLIAAAAFTASAQPAAGTSAATSGRPLVRLLRQVDWDFKSLVQGTGYARPGTSQAARSPDAYLPRYEAAISLRPDLYYSRDRLALSIKPRLDAAYRIEENSGGEDNEETDTTVFINAWLARLRLSDGLFVSYGRENIQWGGAYLFSPSNPFFTDNGRRNPKKEVAGMDFARLVAIPDMAWTLSLMAHTGEGAQDFDGPFETAYAVKLDHNAEAYYLSAIAAYRDDFGHRLGLYGGLTCSDALLVYMEGAIGELGAMLYPLRGGDFTAGAELDDALEADTLTGSLLVGAAYTLAMGPTLTAEYLYNGPGERVESYGAELKADRRARDYAFFENRHYGLFQYTHNDIADVCDLILRITHGMDDHSGQVTAIAEYDLSDHLVLYGIGNINYGPRDTEYGGQLDHNLTVGIEYTY